MQLLKCRLNFLRISLAQSQSRIFLGRQRGGRPVNLRWNTLPNEWTLIPVCFCTCQPKEPQFEGLFQEGETCLAQVAGFAHNSAEHTAKCRLRFAANCRLRFAGLVHIHRCLQDGASSLHLGHGNTPLRRLVWHGILKKGSPSPEKIVLINKTESVPWVPWITGVEGYDANADQTRISCAGRPRLDHTTIVCAGRPRL